jgi:uncharacterized membrane protein YdjX (TVP38/TMEM64 family)
VASAQRRLALLFLIAGLLGLAWAGGAFQSLGDLEKTRARLDSLGPWAYVAFVASFALFQPLGVPAIFWVLPAALLWPFELAFPLSLAGAVGGASVGFVFARYLARDWVAERVPDRLRRFDERFAARGLAGVIVVRLLFHLFPPTHWALGLSRVSYGVYALGTFIASAFNIGIVTYFGKPAFDWIEEHAALSWAILGAIIAAALVARRVRLARK